MGLLAWSSRPKSDREMTERVHLPLVAEFPLSVVAPDRTVFEDRITSLIAPGVEGYFGIFSSHEPLIAALQAGVVECRYERGDLVTIAVSGGFLEVSDNKVIILADDAVRAAEVDVAAAEKELEEARKALRGESSAILPSQADAVIRKAMARIRAARKAS
jgi:F-type H+-transporting ATPase subunit epsilon